MINFGSGLTRQVPIYVLKLSYADFHKINTDSIHTIPDNHKSDQAAITYQPPLRDPDVDLKRTMRKLTKLSQDAQK